MTEGLYYIKSLNVRKWNRYGPARAEVRALVYTALPTDQLYHLIGKSQAGIQKNTIY